MSKDLSERVEISSVGATYELAGLQPGQLRGNQAWLPAPLTRAGLSRLQLPDQYITPEEYEAALRNFKKSFFDISDQMPSVQNVFYSGGSNSRFANFNTYLQYADTGAINNLQYKQQFELAEAKYQKAVEDLNAERATAYAIWTVKFPKAKDEDFDAWSENEYFKANVILDKEAQVKRTQSLRDSAATLYLGPLGTVLVDWKDKAADADNAKRLIPDYNMVVDEVSEKPVLRPLYDTDIDIYESWYTNALLETGGQDPIPFKVTKDLHSSSASYQELSKYGLAEGSFKQDAFVAFPFLFWGETMVASKEESWSNYQQNNVQSATISICSWTTPRVISTNPGRWHVSDPMTTFQKLIRGAPTNPGALVYPYVSSIAVTYGLGYKVVLDQSSFQSLYDHVYKKTEARHVSFFGWLFNSDQQIDAKSEMTTDGRSIAFDSDTRTVTIQPSRDTIPTLLGVVVEKEPTTESLAGALIPAGRLGAISPAASRLLTNLTSLTGRVESFLQIISDTFGQLDRKQSLQLVGAMYRVFEQGQSLKSLLDILEYDSTDSKDGHSNGAVDRNEIKIEQKNGRVITSITICSSTPERHEGHNGVMKGPANQAMASATQSLAPFISAPVTSRASGPRVIDLISLGLANLGGLILEDLPAETTVQEISSWLTGSTEAVGSVEIGWQYAFQSSCQAVVGTQDYIPVGPGTPFRTNIFGPRTYRGKISKSANGSIIGKMKIRLTAGNGQTKDMEADISWYDYSDTAKFSFTTPLPPNFGTDWVQIDFSFKGALQLAQTVNLLLELETE